MEIKMPKEIRDYEETVFLGLTVRQLVCSGLAVAAAAVLYFLLHGFLGREPLSWVCILGAAPFAFAGFFRYNGMTFERFVWAAIKSELLMSGNRVWKAKNYYLELIKKEVWKSNEPV